MISIVSLVNGWLISTFNTLIDNMMIVDLNLSFQCIFINVFHDYQDEDRDRLIQFFSLVFTQLTKELDKP